MGIEYAACGKDQVALCNRHLTRLPLFAGKRVGK